MWELLELNINLSAEFSKRVISRIYFIIYKRCKNVISDNLIEQCKETCQKLFSLRCVSNLSNIIKCTFTPIVLHQWGNSNFSKDTLVNSLFKTFLKSQCNACAFYNNIHRFPQYNQMKTALVLLWKLKEIYTVRDFWIFFHYGHAQILLHVENSSIFRKSVIVHR